MILAQNNGPPPIPEPDYSCSESEVETDEERKDMSKLQTRLAAVQLHPVENSGNSNTRFVQFCNLLVCSEFYRQFLRTHNIFARLASTTGFVVC